jgi:hypothetical protein
MVSVADKPNYDGSYSFCELVQSHFDRYPLFRIVFDPSAVLSALFVSCTLSRWIVNCCFSTSYRRSFPAFSPLYESPADSPGDHVALGMAKRKNLSLQPHHSLILGMSNNPRREVTRRPHYDVQPAPGIPVDS